MHYYASIASILPCIHVFKFILTYLDQAVLARQISFLPFLDILKLFHSSLKSYLSHYSVLIVNLFLLIVADWLFCLIKYKHRHYWHCFFYRTTSSCVRIVFLDRQFELGTLCKNGNDIRITGARPVDNKSLNVFFYPDSFFFLTVKQYAWGIFTSQERFAFYQTITSFYIRPTA